MTAEDQPRPVSPPPPDSPPASAAPEVTIPDAAAVSPAAATDDAQPRRSPAGKIGGLILLLLLGTLAWQVASDRIAPASKTGAVAAFTAQVAPRVSGQVVRIHVADNERVIAGAPLFSLDPAPFDLAVLQAEAALAQALLAIEASTVSLTAAEAQVAQSRASLTNTRASTERTRGLFERGLATQADTDAAETQLTAAQSAYDAAAAQLESARMQLGSAEHEPPQVQVARVQLLQARLNREFADVLAPTDGVVTNLRMALGQYLGAGTPAITFIETIEPWITVDLRENQLGNVHVGDAAQVLFDAVPGHTFAARVRGIAWGIDTGRTAANGLPQNQASTRWFEPARTIPVQLELARVEDWPQNVRVGSKVTAVIYAGNSNGPVAWISTGLQWVRSYISYLY